MNSKPSDTAAASVPQAPEPVAGRRRPPRGWRLWLFRLLALTLVPGLQLLLFEAGLRLAGFGEPTAFFLDGAPVGARSYLVENPGYGKRFFPPSLRGAPPPLPFALPAVKAPGTFRVFVLGESAAQGFPDPSSSFAHVLEAMLRERYPQTRFELVNTAMVAVNSHVIRAIAAECAAHQPDLFVVLLGNNEVVGPFGAASVLGAYAPSRTLIRAQVELKATRTGQLVSRLVQGFVADPNSPQTWKGMQTFLGAQVRADDPRLDELRATFAANLDDVCRAGIGAGAAVAVCTVPVNLRDCAPFASAHAPDLSPEHLAEWDRLYHAGGVAAAAGQVREALRQFAAAAAIDGEHAELVYRLGQGHAALGQWAEAQSDLARARDLDTLRFRCDSGLNAAIRAVCERHAGVYLVDAEQSFARAAPGGIPGEESFFEHVHLNFQGNVRLAQSVFRTITDVLPTAVRGQSPARLEPPTEAECTAWLAYTDWTELHVVTQLHDSLLQQPPFTNQFDHAERDRRWAARVAALRRRLKEDGLQPAIAAYRQAVARAEDDWMLHMNLGQLLAEARDADGALEQYEAAVRALPHNFPAQTKIGTLLLDRGRASAAEPYFRKALQCRPDYAEARRRLAEALAAQGYTDEALATCAGLLELPTERYGALLLCGKLLHQQQRTAQAEARVAEAAELVPEDPGPHVLLGEFAEQEGRRSDAVAHFEAALRRRPEWPELAAHLERLRRGRLEEQPHAPR